MTEDQTRRSIAAEVARGDDALKSADLLLGAGQLADAVSRAYYAALHYGRALLLTFGEESRGRTAASNGSFNGTSCAPASSRPRSAPASRV